MDYREYWQEIDEIAALLSDPDALAQEYGEDAEPSEVLWEITDGHQFIIYTFKAFKVLEHSDNTDAYFEDHGDLTVGSLSDFVTPVAMNAMQADIVQRMQRENPSRARRHGGGRRNLPADQHQKLSAAWGRAKRSADHAAHTAWRTGDQDDARFWREMDHYSSGQQNAHATSQARPSASGYGPQEYYDSLQAASDVSASAQRSVLKHEGREATNPPRDGKWQRVPAGLVGHGYLLMTGDGYARIIAYKPRSKSLGYAARAIAEVYENQKGQKVPKGTKYLSFLKLHGVPRIQVLGAHKTLKPAKSAAAKALGADNPPRKRRRARANASGSSAPVALVKTSARARPVRVKLPAKTKPERVGDLTVHRSISYKGAKLRLLKGWTVTTSAGRGVGRYKTKQAAMSAARRAR